MTLAVRPLEPADLEQRMLFEQSLRAGEVQSRAAFLLLLHVCGPAHSGWSGAARTLVQQLRHKLGDDTERPTYIFNVPRVGYRMLRSEWPHRQDPDG